MTLEGVSFDKVLLKQTLQNQYTADQAAIQADLKAAGITTEFIELQNSLLQEQNVNNIEASRKINEELTLKLNELHNSKTTRGLINRSYNRNGAVNYASAWWNKRNPAWGNFNNLGGDCTNFVSQVINAGSIPEDKAGSYLWFYDYMGSGPSSTTRSSSWSGVNEFYNYIIGNTTYNGYNGPQGHVVSAVTELQKGDVVQLQFSGASSYGHTMVVVSSQYEGLSSSRSWVVRVAYHTTDTWNRKLSDITFMNKRFIHIDGWRAQ